MIQYNNIEWEELSEISLISERGRYIYSKSKWNGAPAIIKMENRRKDNVAFKAQELEEELSILSHFHHKNIIELYGAGWRNGSRYLVLEYFQEGTLADFILNMRRTQIKTWNTLKGRKGSFRRKRGKIINFFKNMIAKSNVESKSMMRHPMTLVELIKIGRDLAEALHYLHEEANPQYCFIYGNLNPCNVGLTCDGRAKLLDFGLTRKVRRDVNGARSNFLHEDINEIEIARYLSPEFFMYSFYTKSVDVYSWALIMSELLTLETPYKELALENFRVEVAMNKVRPNLLKEIPSPLRYLICRCWGPNPYFRPRFSIILYYLKYIEIGHTRERMRCW